MEGRPHSSFRAQLRVGAPVHPPHIVAVSRIEMLKRASHTHTHTTRTASHPCLLYALAVPCPTYTALSNIVGARLSGSVGYSTTLNCAAGYAIGGVYGGPITQLYTCSASSEGNGVWSPDPQTTCSGN